MTFILIFAIIFNQSCASTNISRKNESQNSKEEKVIINNNENYQNIEKEQALRNENAEENVDQSKKLRDAVVAKNWDNVKDLVLNGADINAIVVNDRSSFLQIACHGNYDILSFVFEGRGADRHAKTLGGKNALHIAAECGNLSTVEYLLSVDFNPKEVDYNNNSVLFYAKKSRNKKVKKAVRISLKIQKQEKKSERAKDGSSFVRKMAAWIVAGIVVVTIITTTLVLCTYSEHGKCDFEPAFNKKSSDTSSPKTFSNEVR